MQIKKIEMSLIDEMMIIYQVKHRQYKILKKDKRFWEWYILPESNLHRGA